MKPPIPALLLAAAMIGIALPAVVDAVPETYAQFAPLALIALFPGVWMKPGSRCQSTGCGRSEAH